MAERFDIAEDARGGIKTAEKHREPSPCGPPGGARFAPRTRLALLC